MDKKYVTSVIEKDVLILIIYFKELTLVICKMLEPRNVDGI